MEQLPGGHEFRGFHRMSFADKREGFCRIDQTEVAPTLYLQWTTSPKPAGYLKSNGLPHNTWLRGWMMRLDARWNGFVLRSRDAERWWYSAWESRGTLETR